MDLRTAHALVRFGMGPSGAQPPPADPSAWLLNQIRQPDWTWGSPSAGPLPTTAQGLAAIREDREDRLAARQADLGTAAGQAAPGPATRQTDPGMTDGRRFPRMADGRAFPGMTNGRAVPGMADGQTDLGMADGRRFPGMADGRAFPGMADGRAFPGMPNGRAFPGMVDGRRFPGMVDGRAAPGPATAQAATPGQSRSRTLYRAQGLAAVARAVMTQTPFRERLVWFWTNHFTISLRRPQCAAVAGAFVQEAIRPHVTGRFQDMLLAVMRHPAMLLYLDNAGSVGPDSMGGQRSHRGLNENLARECMELHTVTPAADYTQADVTAFARILTGWSIELRNDPPGFVFRPRIHEPGEQTLLGRRFPDGEDGGIEALRYLANHPATHRSLATKLVCHFVADTPPPAAVRRIEGILRDTGGDLGAAAAGLVGLDEAWTPGSKIRTPLDLVVASFRLLEVPPDPSPPFLAILADLGQPLWAAPAPNGWSDVAADWSGPEAMMRRIDWAFAVSGRIGDRDPMAIAEASLGPLYRPATRDAMARAGSRREAMTMLLTSPEFQRR